MRTLIIAEKPGAGREIADALGVTKKLDGSMESDEYIISWAAGHLVTLKEPHEYNEKWKDWSLETLPILPEKYELKISSNETKKQFNILKKYLTSSNVSKVINACDAGREGELIFDYIYRLSGSKIPAYRLWTSAALTAEAIKRELQRLKPIEEFNGLRLAARARSTADWVIGMNSTRAITLAAQKSGNKGVFSVGRVQTPTLFFLVSREIEIKNFKAKPFWVIKGNFLTEKNQTYLGNYEYQNDSKFISQIYSISDAKMIMEECEGSNAKIVKVESKDGSTSPPLLFDLTELQKECNKRFGLSADKTLEIAQILYEKHKCLSYPRTEFRHLTEDNRETIPNILEALKDSFDNKFIKKVNETYKETNKRIFDNSKVGDHHALLPTSVSPKNLQEIEEKVYRLVVNRFLAVFSPNFEFKSSIIAALCNGKHLFVTRGKIVKKLGWKQIENDAEEDISEEQEEQNLPDLKLGDPVTISKLNLKEDKTKSPPRYNDSSLLSAMQNPSSKAENKEDKDALKSYGLGTPATRAAIIKNLELKGYIEREKKAIKPTQKAFDLFSMLQKFNQSFLCNPVMTAEWEKTLQTIEREPAHASSFLQNLNLLTMDIVSNIKKAI
ncbi:DNA topoisomerase III (plasmid) [Silvanigrella paludirubra]|uniref:DNA topoisomerase n=1 Tax=Silvanigrella paludirubra TaxID=2499159 RepID=A0A6N6VML2_9BACT|nr:DNA topoisomerase 3 [Silvanigrella paludirubra]KAB8035619.1 DNA topoisomerase III [Silvanigrella paludirubra]MBX9837484.1 DNA topoisomerase 3 [Silvanigrellaceae bacterium]